MKRKVMRLVLASLALGGTALAGSTGCLYLRDSAWLDLQAAGRLPRAFADGVRRDIDVYRPAPPPGSR